jgi:uncharacterized membrane protein
VRHRRSFGEDFQRFFLRGLGTLLPTIITIALIWYVLNFLWDSIGWYVIWAIGRLWYLADQQGWVEPTSAGYIGRYLEETWYIKPLGVILALVLIYLVGLLVGNFIGRAFYRLAERLVMRIPVVRALYPAVKQVTDFLLTDRTTSFAGSRVVAVQPHEGGIWSVGLVTGSGLEPLSERTGEEMVTVFVPSSPTAFSGYVMVVPRSGVVELPMTVEEAMRLLISGGVLAPRKPSAIEESAQPALPSRPHEAARKPATPRALPQHGQAAPGPLA